MKCIGAIFLVLVILLPGYAFASVDVLAGGWWDASIEELLLAREQIDVHILALGGELPDSNQKNEILYESDTQSTITTTEIARFDISQFEDKEFCYVTIDDIESRAFINVEYYGKVGSAIRPTDGTPRLLSTTYMCPDVYVYDYGKESELPVLRILIDYGAENWLFADSVIFKIGNLTYTFENLDSENGREVRSNGYINEHLTILIGKENLEFIEAICEGENDIKLRIKGANGYKDFEVKTDDIFFSDVKQMYETMCSAGGLDQTYLKRVPASSMIVK